MGQQLEQEFDYWWEMAHVEISVHDEQKLRNAFLDVLVRMSVADRQKFFSANPVVLCFGAIGVAESFAVPSPPNEQLGELNIIFLRHDIVRRKRMVDEVAHEMAHIVRGDHKRHLTNRTSYKDEKGADDLSEGWGFRRSYSKRRLAALKQLSKKPV